MNNFLEDQDPQVSAIINSELARQRQTLELIASENFASPAVLAASGSVFTNKYAEGYTDHRYYGGCEFADQIETLAITRARKIFRAEHVNVQPHSGSQANMAAYFALMKPGECLLGMSLAHGGHLTHGAAASFSGRLFNVQAYGVRPDTELIDYDDLMEKAERLKPKVIVAGASAYPRQFDFAKFREAADLAEAALVVDMAHFAGLVAAGLHPSPMELADIVTSTTHKTLRGPRGGLILCKSGLARAVDAQIFPGLQGGPLVHQIAAKAVAFGEALTADFMDYQQQVIQNAARLANNLTEAGFRLVSGGTSNHLLLVDLRSKNLTGAQAETALERAGITTNKNAIPFDPQPPTITSGLRLGTPAVTTRGLVESDMDLVAELIVETLRQPDDDLLSRKIRRKVETICQDHPLYPEL
ncbi:MAG: serine hydroxymethyltransferase [Candidatus Adiutrix sp.]|jgi:glycine hydroxymethyltransferase|nr:serine hydroxymethyltransferase [Candidatus Adiutrix sp.]